MDITSYIMGSIAGAKSASGLRYLVVDTLPSTGQNNIIYLVRKQSPKQKNVFDEYMWINNDWEIIGDTEIDLSNYQTLLTSSNKLNADYIDDTNTTNKLTNATEKSTWNGKQDALVSGTNIKTINGNSILGSGDLSVEPKYITDGDGNKLYFVKYSTDSTYVSNILAPIFRNLINDFNNNKKSYLCVADFYTPNTSNYDIIENKANIYFIANKNIRTDDVRYNLHPLFETYMQRSIDGVLSVNHNRGYISYKPSTDSINGWFLTPAITNLGGILWKNNTYPYTPTGDYNPATKKYVDDSIASAIGTALGGSY